MKRFVAVCTAKHWSGVYESAVVGVTAKTEKAAQKKARELAKKVTGSGNFSVTAEAVTEEAQRALEDKCYEWYLFSTGAIKRNSTEAYAEWGIVYPFWETACWDGDRIIVNGVRVI